MKKLSLFFLIVIPSLFIQAQEQYLGMATSPRGGIIAADLNPSELSNLHYKYEVGIFSIGSSIYNDRANLLTLDTDDQTKLILKLFKGDHTTNIRANASTTYPSFAMRTKKWAFGINVKTNAAAALFDTGYNTNDYKLTTINGGDPIFTTSINTNGNSRITAATWSEINLSSSRILIENKARKLNAGATIKLLFPASYMNLSIDKLDGTAVYDSTQKTVAISDIDKTQISIDYTGDDSKNAFGGLNGVGADIGFTYTVKDSTEFPKIKLGLAIKNIGSMTYKSADPTGRFNTHILSTTNADIDFDKLTKNDNVETIADLENELDQMGVLTNSVKSTSRTVNLPTSINLNADFKIVPRFHTGIFIKQRLTDASSTAYAIPTQNVVAVTARYAVEYFDIYTTWGSYEKSSTLTKTAAFTELSGIVGGGGFRIGGFYVGSTSLFTGLANGKQIDVHMGARWAFGK